MATSVYKAAQIDLEQINSPVQRELHEIPKGNEKDKLFNHFEAYSKKHTLDVKSISRMKSSPEQEGMTYTPDIKMDYILYIYSKLKILTMSVKREYRKTVRIAWTHNLLHHIVLSGHLCLDDDETLTLDSNWLDIYSQYFVKHVNKDYNGNAGIVPELENFSSSLPEKNVGITIPFGFSTSKIKALPLFDVNNKVDFMKWTHFRSLAVL